jgi:uncharacterized membrane protein
MKNRLVILAEKIRSSYWFIPGTMAVLAAILSLVTIELDKSLENDPAWVVRLIYVDSAESARAVLSTVASSMITVAGVVFSLTMVVLSLTSQQYGPLVLNQFMRDRGNQLVLGIFTSTFVFCLLILRTIRGGEDNVLVPHISVMTGLGLAIVSLALLIFFIHHVAESIHSTNIIARVSQTLLEGIDIIFPEELGREAAVARETDALQAISRRLETEGQLVQTRGSGYLQIVDDEKLFQVAREHKLIVQIKEQPGHFFVKGDLLARILGMQRFDENVVRKVQNAIVLGVQRTENQDIEFLLIPLVSIAVRALSPGINDPHTAIMCMDRLLEALCKLLQRNIPSKYRYDEAAHLRVISQPVSFETLFHTAFDQIRHYGHGDLKVMMHLMEIVGKLSSCSADESYKQLFEQYLAGIHQESRAQFTNPIDLQQLDMAYAAALHLLRQNH